MIPPQHQYSEKSSTQEQADREFGGDWLDQGQECKLRTVFVDVTSLMPKQISGIGVYSANLFNALQAESGLSWNIRPVTKLSRILKPSCVADHIGHAASTFWPVIGELNRKNIFHGLDFHLLTATRLMRRVVTIHDLAVFHEGFNAEKFRLRGQGRLADLVKNERPDHIVVPSYAVQVELLERFPELKGRVTAIHHGGDHNFSASKSEGKSNCKEPFFLFVGNIEMRKNLIRVVEAFTQFYQRHPDFKLILVGKDGFGADQILRVIEKSPARIAIERKTYIENSELGRLFESAAAFVFPSLYEGFGIPAVEAFYRGCPLITSNSGALKEVAQDAAILVDPTSITEIAQAMQEIASDTNRSNELISRGEIRARDFTWVAAARQLLEVYAGTY